MIIFNELVKYNDQKSSQLILKKQRPGSEESKYLIHPQTLKETRHRCSCQIFVYEHIYKLYLKATNVYLSHR